MDLAVVDAFEATVNDFPFDRVIVFGAAWTVVVVAMVFAMNFAAESGLISLNR